MNSVLPTIMTLSGFFKKVSGSTTVKEDTTIVASDAGVIANSTLTPIALDSASSPRIHDPLVDPIDCAVDAASGRLLRTTVTGGTKLNFLIECLRRRRPRNRHTSAKLIFDDERHDQQDELAKTTIECAGKLSSLAASVGGCYRHQDDCALADVIQHENPSADRDRNSGLHTSDAVQSLLVTRATTATKVSGGVNTHLKDCAAQPNAPKTSDANHMTADSEVHSVTTISYTLGENNACDNVGLRDARISGLDDAVEVASDDSGCCCRCSCIACNDAAVSCAGGSNGSGCCSASGSCCGASGSGSDSALCDDDDDDDDDNVIGSRALDVNGEGGDDEENCGHVKDDGSDIARRRRVAQIAGGHDGGCIRADACVKGDSSRRRQQKKAAGSLEEKKSVSQWSVCGFAALPDWLQDNDFLLEGHRPPLYSFRACFGSLLRVHSESINIWSHLIGATAFACTGAAFLRSPLTATWPPSSPTAAAAAATAAEALSAADRLAFGVFFACVTLCFATSTLYHTLHCHSLVVSRRFSRLDYCGIVSIVAGCFTPWIHFLFWCQPWAKLFYLALGYALCALTVNVTMSERFGHSQYRSLRAAVFTGLGVGCSLVPGAHFIVVHGWRAAFVDLAFGWLLAMAAVAMFGVALYALRVPERFWPGAFDIVCHSHQFFHVAVIVGAYVHLHCIWQMALHRHGAGALCPTSSVAPALMATTPADSVVKLFGDASRFGWPALL